MEAEDVKKLIQEALKEFSSEVEGEIKSIWEENRKGKEEIQKLKEENQKLKKVWLRWDERLMNLSSIAERIP